MKRSILILAAVFFMSLTAAYAQRDTTETAPSVDYTKDLVKIKAGDLPQPVQEALAAPMYQGWETGEIYRSQTSDQYMIRFGDATTPKTFYFDPKGKPITRDR